MLVTNAVRVSLERRSPQLDQWFAEDRCSFIDDNNLIQIIQQVQPDEGYNLVARSHVAVSL